MKETFICNGGTQPWVKEGTKIWS